MKTSSCLDPEAGSGCLRPRAGWTGVFAGVILLAALAPSFANEGMTTWTSADGVTIHARFVGCDGNHVILLRNGRDYRVPQERLSAESIRKVQRLLDGPDHSRSPVEKAAAPAACPGPALRPDPPCRGLAGHGAARPKDRHGMPIYAEEPHRLVRTTAYTCTEADHLRFGSRSAAGTPLRADSSFSSAAADWSLYPVGTVFKIKGISRLFVVDDYGSALVGTGTIDLYMPDHAAMDAWGCRKVEITVVKWGSHARGAALLYPRIHHAHCRRMYAAIVSRMSAKSATGPR